MRGPVAAVLLILCSVLPADSETGSSTPPAASGLTDEVPPKREVRAVGTEGRSSDAASLGDLERPALSMESSAYCEEGTTASGQQTRDGIAASNRFRFGTRIKILSGPLAGKVVEVQDRHAKRFTNLLDVFIQSCAAALEYGRRQIKVAVL